MFEKHRRSTSSLQFPMFFVSIQITSPPRNLAKSKLFKSTGWAYLKDEDDTPMRKRLEEFSNSMVGIVIPAFCPIYPPGMTGYVEEEYYGTLTDFPRPIPVFLPNEIVYVSKEDYLLIPPDLKRPNHPSSCRIGH